MDVAVEEPPQVKSSGRVEYGSRCNTRNGRRSRANPAKVPPSTRPCTEEERERVIRYIPLAHSLCRDYGRRDNLGDEAISVAFLALTKAAQDFKPELGHCFSTYAHVCIIDKLNTAFRKKRHLRGYQHRPEGLMLNSLTLMTRDWEGESDDVADHRRERDLASEEEVQWLLRHAHPEERELVRLHFWCGYTKSEIGAMKGVSKQRIDQRISRVLRRLKAILTNPDRKNPDDTASNSIPHRRKHRKTRSPESTTGDTNLTGSLPASLE